MLGLSIEWDVEMDSDFPTMIADARQLIGVNLNDEGDHVAFELTDLRQKVRADEGSLIDQYHLGKAYLKEGNVQKAEYYFAISANGQCAKAEYQLGLLYETVYKNSPAALCCYQRAVAKGHAGAQFKVAMSIKESMPTQAFVYFKAAADQDLALAQFYTALCFKYGRGVDQDQNQAATYFKKAACEGFKEKSAFDKFCESLARSNPNIRQALEAEMNLWHA